MSKQLLCPCEDVTASEVQHAIDKGYRDIESVKRFTGFGTGMCQGKQCLHSVARFLSQNTDLTPAQLEPFTPRPPLFPTELSLWASAKFDPEGAKVTVSYTGGKEIVLQSKPDGTFEPLKLKLDAEDVALVVTATNRGAGADARVRALAAREERRRVHLRQQWTACLFDAGLHDVDGGVGLLE